MNKNKLNTITGLFEGKEIRSIWSAEKEDYYFSAVDIIYARKGWQVQNYWYLRYRRDI